MPLLASPFVTRVGSRAVLKEGQMERRSHSSLYHFRQSANYRKRTDLHFCTMPTAPWSEEMYTEDVMASRGADYENSA